jgi:UDP-3-O-[3-hydroxymyristoyl] glucosamine N-acyltransferase
LLVSELASALELPFEGNGNHNVFAAAPLETAGWFDLAFVGNAKAAQAAHESTAGCLIVPADFVPQRERTVLRSSNPRGSFARAVGLLYPPRPVQPGVHPAAQIAPGASVSPEAEVGAFVTIGPGTTIEAGCRIDAGCRIAGDCYIRADSVLHSNVTLYSGTKLGRRVVLHSGCVLGADGFGFVLEGGRYHKFPQVGRVEIDDDVEIGANSCVDRAALGVTSIGEGTKIDNMVHIGHNCRIGRHVVIAAQTGLSGGVVVEDYAVIGGQVGIGDKARIESGAVLGSGCGILTSKIVRKGEVVWGTPARPLKQHLAQLANLGKVSELRSELKQLQAAIEELRRQK